jgi:hypothetical protein
VARILQRRSITAVVECGLGQGRTGDQLSPIPGTKKDTSRLFMTTHLHRSFSFDELIAAYRYHCVSEVALPISQKLLYDLMVRSNLEMPRKPASPGPCLQVNNF